MIRKIVSARHLFGLGKSKKDSESGSGVFSGLSQNSEERDDHSLLHQDRAQESEVNPAFVAKEELESMAQDLNEILYYKNKAISFKVVENEAGQLIEIYSPKTGLSKTIFPLELVALWKKSQKDHDIEKKGLFLNISG